MQLTIKKLLMMLIGVVAMVTIFLMVFSYKTTQNVERLVTQQHGLSEQFKALSAMRFSATELVLAAMDSIIDQAEMHVSDERMEIIHHSANSLFESIKSLEGTFESPEDAALFVEVTQEIPSLVQAVRDDLPLAIQRGLTEASTAAIDDAIDGAGDVLDKNLEQLQKQSFVHLGEITRQVEEAVGFSERFFQVSFILSLLIILPLGWYVYRYITSSLNMLAECMEKLAKGHSEIEIYGYQQKNEVGRMARTIQVFKEGMVEKERLEKEGKEAAIRAELEKRQLMQELANGFESKVQNIIHSVAAAATELYHTSESMSEIINSATQKAGSVASSSSEASQNVQTVAAAAEEMSASVKEISQQIIHSTDAVRIVVEQMEKADATSKMLEEATQRIGDIVNLIQDIAGQINLLALNATIESARAGEAGKGFAVVASEVKNLATQTTVATGNISDNITNIREVSEEVIQTLAAIKGAINSVNEISSSISSAVEEQSAVTNEIASNMSHASSGTRRINEDIGEVSRASSDASASAVQTLDAARMLSQQAEMLQREIGDFLNEVRAA